ncbi:hypothetical protein [Lysinibacillus fusiformis]|nr:hypothetical protein [Lysinibacillus fusiformis]
MNEIERLELQRFQEEEEQAKRETYMAINGFFENEEDNYYHG